MSGLSPAARRALRARAHHLRPFVTIGEAGTTSAVFGEIDRCLQAHELIKVRALAADRAERNRLVAEICRALGAEPVQHIGRIFVLFRPRAGETPPPAAAPVAARQAPRLRRT
jgi:putative YhbY family RNA-binding protein